MMPEFVVLTTAGSPRQRLFSFQAENHFPGDSPFREVGGRPSVVGRRQVSGIFLFTDLAATAKSNTTEVVP